MRKTRLIPILIAALAVLAALAAGCTESSAGPGVVPGGQVVAINRFDDRYPSTYSGFGEPARIVVDDAAQWAEVWDRLWNDQAPAPPLPAVDFQREVVIVAAMGRRPTGGYHIRVQEAAAHADHVAVTVVEAAPGVACVVTQAFTAPTDVVRVARAGLPVRFRTVEAAPACA